MCTFSLDPGRFIFSRSVVNDLFQQTRPAFPIVLMRGKREETDVKQKLLTSTA